MQDSKVTAKSDFSHAARPYCAHNWAIAIALIGAVDAGRNKIVGVSPAQGKGSQEQCE
jgi:hypothetical protein